MARPSAVAERRREILEATCEVVAARGFRDLRIADVAKIAGYSTGTVHYYFASKEELLTEAFRFQYEESRQRRDVRLEAVADPVARLRTLAECYLPTTDQAIRSWRVWLELWASALTDPGLREINDVHYDDWRQAVLDAVAEGVDQGRIKVADPVVYADTVVGMLDGLAIQVLIGSTHMTAERMNATCKDLIDRVVQD